VKAATLKSLRRAGTTNSTTSGVTLVTAEGRPNRPYQRGLPGLLSRGHQRHGATRNNNTCTSAEDQRTHPRRRPRPGIPKTAASQQCGGVAVAGTNGRRSVARHDRGLPTMWWRSCGRGQWPAFCGVTCTFHMSIRLHAVAYPSKRCHRRSNGLRPRHQHQPRVTRGCRVFHGHECLLSISNGQGMRMLL
jgi:hypothetical protein